MKIFLISLLAFATAALAAAELGHSGIREDFAQYETSDGYLTGHRNPENPDGNSLLFSAEKLFVLDMLGQLEAVDTIVYSRLLKKCEVTPGVYTRTPPLKPYWSDAESQDDYIGIIAASKLLGLGIENDVWGADLPLQLWRFPGLYAHGVLSVGQDWFFERALWDGVIWTSGRWDAANQDPWALSWLMIETRGNLDSWVVHDWKVRLRNQWPNGGLGEVFARYFNDPNHPLAKYLWGFPKGDIEP